MAATIV